MTTANILPTSIAKTFAAAPAASTLLPVRRPLSSRLELLGVLSLMLSSAAYALHALSTLAP